MNLFFPLLATLIISGNTWDGLSMDYVYSIPQVLLKIIGIFILISGLVSVGQRRPSGIKYLFYIYIIGLPILGFGFKYSLVLSLILGVPAIIVSYYFYKEPPQPSDLSDEE